MLVCGQSGKHLEEMTYCLPMLLGQARLGGHGMAMSLLAWCEAAKVRPSAMLYSLHGCSGRDAICFLNGIVTDSTPLNTCSHVHPGQINSIDININQPFLIYYIDIQHRSILSLTSIKKDAKDMRKLTLYGPCCGP